MSCHLNSRQQSCFPQAQAVTIDFALATNLLVITPTYSTSTLGVHRRYLSLHHRERCRNFCLFMPALDLAGGTLDERAWALQRAAYDGGPGGGALGTPEFVFLAHVVDMMSSMHVPFALRSLSSTPFANHFILLPFWPVAFGFMLLMWCCSKTFVVSFYCLRGHLHQTWSVPRYGFQVN